MVADLQTSVSHLGINDIIRRWCETGLSVSKCWGALRTWEHGSRPEGQGDALGGRDGQTWNRTKLIMFTFLAPPKEVSRVGGKPAGFEYMGGFPAADEGMGSVGTTWWTERLRFRVCDIMKLWDTRGILVTLASARPSEGFLKDVWAGNVVPGPSPDSSLGTLCR